MMFRVPLINRPVTTPTYSNEQRHILRLENSEIPPEPEYETPPPMHAPEFDKDILGSTCPPSRRIPPSTNRSGTNGVAPGLP